MKLRYSCLQNETRLHVDTFERLLLSFITTLKTKIIIFTPRTHPPVGSKIQNNRKRIRAALGRESLSTSRFLLFCHFMRVHRRYRGRNKSIFTTINFFCTKATTSTYDCASIACHLRCGDPKDIT